MAPLTAQGNAQLTLGATYSTPIVDDGILDTKLRPAVAPTVGVAFSISTGKGPYRALVEAHYSRSPLNVTEGTGSRDQLASVGVIDALFMLEAPIKNGVRARFGGGAVFYSPSQRQGVFLAGGVRRWIIAGELLWTHQLTPRLSLLVNGRVDSHEFTTPTLRTRGYGGAQSVRRVGLQLGVERKF